MGINLQTSPKTEPKKKKKKKKREQRKSGHYIEWVILNDIRFFFLFNSFLLPLFRWSLHLIVIYQLFIWLLGLRMCSSIKLFDYFLFILSVCNALRRE